MLDKETEVTAADMRTVRLTLRESCTEFAPRLSRHPVYLAELERKGRDQRLPPALVQRLMRITGSAEWDAAVHEVLEVDNLFAELREAEEQAEFDRYDPAAEEPDPHAPRATLTDAGVDYADI